MKHELISMRTRQTGKIVNCSSMLGHSGYAGLSAYSAAQHAVIGLTQAAAREYARTNIRVNAVCPALGSPNLPVVEVILWLCSKRSSFVSGQAIRITGGV
jgi:NAD(P)-dependent dehydrogenase (short-subunit alcohol dehydrogenase family)